MKTIILTRISECDELHFYFEHIDLSIMKVKMSAMSTEYRKWLITFWLEAGRLVKFVMGDGGVEGKDES